MKNIGYLFVFMAFSLFISSCESGNSETQSAAANNPDSLRIVSLNGTITEILSLAGLEDQIVGTDVASTYPESIKSKPKVGHNRKIPVEGVLALNPNLVIGTTTEVTKETVEQFRQAGLKVLLLDQEYSVEGSRNLIRALTDSLNLKLKGDSILSSFDKEIADVKSFPESHGKPKVLFIYARGSGTMMVGGSDTQVDKIIQLAGAVNPAKDFKDYKPLTSESLVNYNPDVLLLFDSGLSSLGSAEGLLSVQGVKQTNAGKNKKIIAMDGQLLSGFSPRLPQAIKELHTKIHE